jgi:hypothetical protein
VKVKSEKGKVKKRKVRGEREKVKELSGEGVT